MHLAVFAALGLAASTAAQTTCDNFGTLRADGSCLCPPGFGGSTCSAPSCGGNIFQGSQRPVSQNSSTGGLSFAGCGCQDGWGGAGCNGKTKDYYIFADYVQSVAPKTSVSRPLPPQEAQPTRGRARYLPTKSATRPSHAAPSRVSMPHKSSVVPLSYVQPRLFNHLTNETQNPTLQAVFPLSAHLNLLRTFDPALSPSPNITSFGSAGSVLAQVFYDGVEQFSCSATSCRQAYSNDTSDWVCESLKCACRNGSAFCGANRVSPISPHHHQTNQPATEPRPHFDSQLAFGPANRLVHRLVLVMFVQTVSVAVFVWPQRTRPVQLSIRRVCASVCD